MSAINKDSAMLLDIQYIRQDRRNGTPDYIYTIWKDLDTGEKELLSIPNPKMEIYFEKPEFRNHQDVKGSQKKENLNKVVVPYKDIVYRIAEEMGPYGKAKLKECFETRNFKALNDFLVYPYVYGADFDIRVYYRQKWRESFNNTRIKTITKGFLDIEVDTLESVGLPNPAVNPIDLVTLIDTNTNTSYTFSLVGVECQERDLDKLSGVAKEKELERRAMYKHRIEEQKYWMGHTDELQAKIHEAYDENYPKMDYKFYFYTDERKMLVHLFQLINKLKLDFIGIWNISFDIPYIIGRLEALGLNPADVICHPDFPVKECFFKKDMINFQVKNKSDFFRVSSYTIFYDQMILYAAIRKGASELRRYSLSYIGEHEVKDNKLDYSEDGNIKTLSYNNWLKYFLYNIKDVLLQTRIEKKTSDVDTYYLYSYENITPYEAVFKQTVKLRAVQYQSFNEQGLIPGENINGYLYNYREERESDDFDDEEDEESDEGTRKTGFEGALVGDPILIDYFGDKLYGRRTNNIFRISIDMDMGAFYPSTIRVMNINPDLLIFKVIVPAKQFTPRGGTMPYHGITDKQLNEHNDDSFSGDIAKEIFDNIQTRNYLSFGHKWLNLPSVNDVYERLKQLA